MPPRKPEVEAMAMRVRKEGWDFVDLEANFSFSSS